MAKPRRPGKRVSKATIRAKADKAEARAKGIDPDSVEMPASAADPLSPAETKVEMERRERGRPTVYDPKVASRILDLLREGRTLTSICRENPGFPSDRTVRAWAADPDHPFSPLYARAREVGYHVIADQSIDLSDDCAAENGAVAKARLQIDTRKWLLAKVLPKIYGDKLALTDPDGGTLKVEFLA